MKVKHNKKRNTAFIFEALTREMTRAVVTSDNKTATSIRKIIKEHFHPGQILHQELDCYDAMATNGLDRHTAEKILFHAKQKHKDLDSDKIFQEQTAVIRAVNSTLGKSFFNTFVPNYKDYATLSSIFGNKVSLKTKVLLENQIIEKLTSELQQEEKPQEVDNLVMSEFCSRFNTKYDTLLESQRSLLQKYIFSFGPNEADFKLYIGNELGRLYEEVAQSKKLTEVSEDPEMLENTTQLLKEMDKFDVSNISEQDVLKILKIQQLVEEYHANDN